MKKAQTRKTVAQQTAEVYNKLGQDYLDSSKKIIPPERDLFSSLFLRGNNILDVGCGGGRDVGFFTKKGFRVTGIDISSVLITLAQKANPHATLECMDVLKMKFSAETFDGVWAQASLLHLKRSNMSRALKKIYHVLKSGGYFHLDMKRGKGEAYVAEKLSGGNERFYTYYLKMELEILLRENGFKIIHARIIKDVHGRANVSWVSILAKK